MKKSLKQILIESLKNRNGYLSTWEAEAITKEAGYKISNYERRMREMEGVEAIYKNPITKDIITGYRLKQQKITLF